MAVPRWCRSVSWSALLLAGCDPRPVQAPTEDAGPLVDALAIPERQTAACASLHTMGAAAVPALREALQEALRTNVDRPSTMLVLYVLAELGATAIDAQPEVADLFRRHSNAEVRRQATWALARLVAPTHDVERCRAGERWIRDYGAADVDQGTYRRSLALLALGRDGTESALEGILRRDDPDGLAALAEALTAGWCESETAGAAFRARLDGLLAHGFRTWDRNWKHELARGPMALARWHSGDRSVAVALGLLHHWDAKWRIAGLGALAAERVWSWPDRLEVVALLSDSDQETRDLAFATVLGWGSAALIALPQLRAAGRECNEPTFAAACQRAADDLVLAATSDASEALRLTVTSADAMLRGEAVSIVPAADGPSRLALVELVRGCRNARPLVIAAFAEAGHSIAASPDGADAFVSLLASGSAEAWQAAAAAIGRCGPALLSTCPDIEATILESGGDYGRHAFAAGMELRAGEHANETDLTAAEAGQEWHVVARALLERARRAGPLPASSLQRARGVHVVRPAIVSQREVWAEARGSGHHASTLSPDLPLLRVAGALALATGGESGWRTGLPEAVANQIAEASLAGQLPELAQQWIETLRRRCLE